MIVYLEQVLLLDNPCVEIIWVMGQVNNHFALTSPTCAVKAMQLLQMRLSCNLLGPNQRRNV
jgi:hypothetical protein